MNKQFDWLFAVIGPVSFREKECDGASYWNPVEYTEVSS